MKTDSINPNAEIMSLLNDERFYHLNIYLTKNKFTDFIAYYKRDEKRAAFIAPKEILINESDSYDIKKLTVSDNPWVIQDGELGIKATFGDAKTDIYSADNIDRLLGLGEAEIYVNDLVGILHKDDFNSFKNETGIPGDLIFSSLVSKYYIHENGALTIRTYKDITKNRLKWLELESIGATCENVGSIENAIIDIILKRVRKTVSITDFYSRKIGLFNYDRQKINFQPYLGRGEHNVFFDFLIGNKYGSFTPYSFLNIVRDSDISKNIYKELIENYSILDQRGCLIIGKTPVSLGKMKSIEDRELIHAVEDILNVAKPLTVIDLIMDIKTNKDEIESNLEEIQLQLPGDKFSYEDLIEYANNLEPETLSIFIQYYQDAKESKEIDDETVKNRGLVLGNDRGNMLLLVTDLVLITNQYYSYLLNFFKKEFPEVPEIHIAYAYAHPIPRNRRLSLHPAVQALRTMMIKTD